MSPHLVRRSGMLSSRVVMLPVLSACLGAPPREPTPPEAPVKPEKQVVLGSTTTMSAGWSETCSKTHWSWEGGKSEHDAPGIPSLERNKVYYTCNEQRFAVDVKCSAKCELVATPDDATYTGSASVDVRALELGVMTIDLELIHAQTSDHRTKRQVIEVIPPETFTIQCFTPAKRWGPCRDGISVEEPMLRVFAQAGGAIHKSSLLRVNGQPAPKGTSFTTGVPLTAFVPSVVPGKVSIVVSLGPKEMTFTLDAGASVTEP